MLNALILVTMAILTLILIFLFALEAIVVIPEFKNKYGKKDETDKV